MLWRNTVPKIPAIDVAKHDPVAEEVIATELDKVLEQGKDIKAALADAQGADRAARSALSGPQHGARELA